uniref:NADH-ubiquinone oxidoreductase chain 1 n=1 Tax=Robertsicus elaphensis TaxID=2599317 RepID=H9M754_9ACAR|nr:NADH dehydrogenase subunit 1 [Robertsicus elaphensis]AET63071.1 NADH dehydrogenase subunit 1 [Robertsicus elaphensis]
MLNFMIFFLILISILISIAFFTLLERKILGYIHIRKGPNKVGFMGMFQPMSDAIKLFTKEMNYMYYMNMIIYIISPIMSIMMMMLLWMMFYLKSKMIFLEMSFIFFLCISSMSAYSILLSGWSSNSKYSLIGSYRGFAQIISYEVSMAMLMMSLCFFPQSFNIKMLLMFQENFMIIYGFFFTLLIWMFICLAETNRTPFDLAESESELVSGFNIEYGSWLFAIIFIAEYGSIMFLSLFSNYLFMGFSKIMTMTLILMLLFIIVRGTFMRFRYDKLMIMAWKMILPSSIITFFLIFLLTSLYTNLFCINFWNYLNI